MKKKDYYLILGVSRTESAEGIKAAFRKLAKEHHPDKRGPDGTRFFQDLAEAYSVLSDPEAREDYTEELRRSEKRGAYGERLRAGSGRSGTGSDFSRAFAEEFSRRFNRGTPSSFLDVLFEMLQSRSKLYRESSRTGMRNLELILSREEALQGGRLAVRIPVRYKCPDCAGSGWNGPFMCLDCEGSGAFIRMSPFNIRIPPGLGDGEILEANLGGGDLIRIHIRVADRDTPE